MLGLEMSEVIYCNLVTISEINNPQAEGNANSLLYSRENSLSKAF